MAKNPTKSGYLTDRSGSLYDLCFLIGRGVRKFFTTDFGAYREMMKFGLKRLAEGDTRRISLRPAGTVKGYVLFSYITVPFFKKKLPDWHAEYWEARQMVQTFLDLGYGVDVIHHRNRSFVPRRPYDFCVDTRFNLERLGPLLNPDCLKIFHANTAHILFHNEAEARRLRELEARRGVKLSASRWEMPYRGIECADCATLLGTNFIKDTFAFAGKPMYHLRPTTTAEYPWLEDKDFNASRRHFVWLGSSGMVHKGLDLILEAFADLPECHLTVCGAVTTEESFAHAFKKELHETPNIHLFGWTDVRSPEFLALVRRSVGFVYVSCSEGAAGSVINLMHAGLIPVTNREAGVDIAPGAGFILPNSGIEEIRRAVRKIADLPAAELKEQARRTWEFARATYTRENFAADYRQLITRLIRERKPK